MNNGATPLRRDGLLHNVLRFSTSSRQVQQSKAQPDGKFSLPDSTVLDFGGSTLLLASSVGHSSVVEVAKPVKMADGFGYAGVYYLPYVPILENHVYE